jgi:hypothetical protein
MDMLIIGTRTNPKTKTHAWTPMTVAQSRAQLSVWAVMKSPLLASADLTDTDRALLDVLTNAEVLAVSDDPLGLEARRLGDGGRPDRARPERRRDLRRGDGGWRPRRRLVQPRQRARENVAGSWGHCRGTHLHI